MKPSLADVDNSNLLKLKLQSDEVTCECASSGVVVALAAVAAVVAVMRDRQQQEEEEGGGEGRRRRTQLSHFLFSKLAFPCKNLYNFIPFCFITM